ncbi:hypothetical protein G6M89_14765 [Natronolimnobius sp. AArcel1]|uniref:hypothetical protein n=1 Tax=Natronolimnobius sp. AArcel1 TaxID=1679093 RepID=UPI0013EC7DF2|nr:hypothetical protein [Natronolimnobius sp. AArcel1]NGM70256.1 hypothetical protein [Natronolimnobius sp. AArcel1]
MTGGIVATTIGSDSVVASEISTESGDLDDVYIRDAEGELDSLTVTFDQFDVVCENLTPREGDLELTINAEAGGTSAELYETNLELTQPHEEFSFDEVFEEEEDAELHITDFISPDTFDAADDGDVTETEVTISIEIKQGQGEEGNNVTVFYKDEFTFSVFVANVDEETFEDPSDEPYEVDVEDYSEVTATIEGAAGGRGAGSGILGTGLLESSGGDGGNGGYIRARANISQIDKLNVWVGEGGKAPTGEDDPGDQTDGLYSGGAGGDSRFAGGSGGGCSAVTTTEIEDSEEDENVLLQESIAIADGGGGGSAATGLLDLGRSSGGGGGGRNGQGGDGASGSSNDGDPGDGPVGGEEIGGAGGDAPTSLVSSGDSGSDGGQTLGQFSPTKVGELEIEELDSESGAGMDTDDVEDGGDGKNAKVSLQLVGKPFEPLTD